MNNLQTHLRVKPYPYQQDGIVYGLTHKRLIIGDEPGLGKTLQSIGIVDTAGAYPCLVICPSSLKINWQREFEKFTDKSALVLDNSVRTTWPYLLKMGMHHVAIVNYESLRKYFVWDIKGGKSFRLKDVVFCPQIKMFKSIIIDESHRVKDPSAQQTIFTKGLSVGKEWIILLSGTPVVNRPEDLVSQLSIMGRLQDFGGATQFKADYCTDPKDKDAEPTVPLSVLSQKLYDTCMIRREKAKVLPQLPDKTRVDLYVDISNGAEYDLAAADLAAYLEQYTECTDWEIRRKMRMEALVRFMTLRQLATLGKVAQAIDFIRTFLANGKKLIVFCSLHEVVDALVKAFPGAVTVTGRDSAVSKQAAVDSFQNNPDTRLIVCSIKAAGVGLTLTASSNVAFVELAWTYADCCQCEDRAHRIGQKDNVTCYYLLGRGTIDHTIYSLIQTKKSIAAEIMNSDDEIPTDEMYFDQLVASFLNQAEHGNMQDGREKDSGVS
jgi:SWI/SNF-related matrix-associated actin-dependent regulator 1 of chromatin subfamily A